MATLKNTNVDDTGFIKLATGTTSERSGSPTAGEVRYNTTTGRFEGYGSAGWHILSPVNLAITSVSIVSGVRYFDSATSSAYIAPSTTTAVFDINGFNFSSGSTVTIDGTSVSSTYINPETIRISIGSGVLTSGTKSTIVVTDPSGITASITYTIIVQGGPVFSTATNLGTVTESGTISLTVAATSSLGAITYSASSSTSFGGSGFGLPTGFSINSSTGVITATNYIITGTRTVNITIRATDSTSAVTDKDFTFILTDNASPTITSPAAGSLATLTYGNPFQSGSGISALTFSTIATVAASDPESNGISYVVSSGSLPDGITLNSSTGVISGTYIIGNRTPASQTYDFGVQAVDTFNNASAERAYSITINTPFLFRQILTTGYVTAGYKDSVAWKNVNRAHFANEVSINLSDVLEEDHNYRSAAYDADTLYSFGVNAATGANSTGRKTVGFNMRTETAILSLPDYAITINQSACIHPIDGFQTVAYISGGATDSRITKWTFSSKTFSSISATTSSTNMVGAWGAATDGYGVFQGGTALGSAASYQTRFTFSTETTSTWSTYLSSSDQQKFIMSKVDKVYGGNGGTYGSQEQTGSQNFRRTLWSTQNQIVISKGYTPASQMGEENYLFGQDRGWGIGIHDGAQNNFATRMLFATDTGSMAAESLYRKGVPGSSSGTCGSRD